MIHIEGFEGQDAARRTPTTILTPIMNSAEKSHIRKTSNITPIRRKKVTFEEKSSKSPNREVFSLSLAKAAVFIPTRTERLVIT